MVVGTVKSINFGTVEVPHTLFLIFLSYCYTISSVSIFLLYLVSFTHAARRLISLLCFLHYVYGIIRVMKPMGMRWELHVARAGGEMSVSTP
jgi:hypothetical protein